MTPEVKKRIEQIRQGIVPEGYKKTESGIIPNEWRVEQVSKCIEEYKFFSNDISHIPVYSSSRKGLVPQSDYYNQREAVETNLGYKVVPQGYVTYRHMSDDDVFHFNINKTGENVLVSSEYPVFTSSDNCDLSFLISVLNNTARFRYFCKMQKLGGTRTRLYLDNLKRYALALPPFDEQKKIAEILSTQDKAIELQGRKIEELKRFKQGCLERMFPREGQKVPEKRFPGFTDDWEQRKLTEFVEFFSGLTYTPNDVQENGTLVLRSSNVSNGEVVDADNVYVNPQVVNSENVKVGDIVVVVRNGSRSLIGKHAQIKAFMPNTVIGAFMTGIRSECPKFTNALLNTSRFEEEIAMNMGATINQITGYMFSKMEFKVPCLDEQKEIGEYFENLDHIITLHQRKLEEMKKQKKALMQLLLTGIVRVKAMNQKEIQEHLTKEALKRIVDNSPNYTEQIKQDLKNIIDAGNTPEEILQATLLYFAALHLS